MNVYQTDFIINIVVTHVQGFPSEILMIFLLETVLNVKESGLMCGIVKVQHSVWESLLMCSSHAW